MNKEEREIRSCIGAADISTFVKYVYVVKGVKIQTSCANTIATGIPIMTANYCERNLFT